MLTFAALVVFEALRILLRLMLISFCWQSIRSALRSLRSPQPSPSLPLPGSLPRVTVQLPMRNEYYVAERIIDMACALDYPRDHLEIQVLDDSDDATRTLVDDRVAARRAEGHPIEVISRETPTEHKAGALNEGVARAHGELIAIFDADCMPAPDFLRQTVPHFADPTIGFVQVRWRFTNRHRSLLTRVQGLVLDGLFTVDQFVQARSGQPVPFNGTGGLWRRRCLEEAGGWSGDSLTEDVDLAFRAYLLGWRAAHRRDYAIPTEIPTSMASFRAQQKRWARGSAQALRRLGGKILRANVPGGAKLAMWKHLARHSVYPLILLTCLAAPLTTLYRMPHLIDYGVPANTALVVCIVASLALLHGAGQAALRQPFTRLLWLPLVMALAIGMSVAYTTAFARGLLQRGGAFERTPKRGDTSAPTDGPRYRSTRDPVALLEVLLGSAQLYFAARALSYGILSYGTFFAVVGLSFLWVGLGSLLSRES